MAGAAVSLAGFGLRRLDSGPSRGNSGLSRRELDPSRRDLGPSRRILGLRHHPRRLRCRESGPRRRDCGLGAPSEEPSRLDFGQRCGNLGPRRRDSGLLADASGPGAAAPTPSPQACAPGSGSRHFGYPALLPWTWRGGAVSAKVTRKRETVIVIGHYPLREVSQKSHRRFMRCSLLSAR